MNPISLNRFVVEPYLTDRGLKVRESNGFAMIQQKVTVKGLKLMMDFQGSINGSNFNFPKGSVAFIREELLHTQPWAQKPLEAEGVEGKFLIIDRIHVEFVVPK